MSDPNNLDGNRDVPSDAAADQSRTNTRAKTAFAQYIAATRQRRRELMLFSCGALTMFSSFAYASYSTLTTNFAQESLRTNAERVGTELVATASPLMIDAAKQAMPVYRAEAERALRDLMPQLTERARAEFDLAAQHMSEKATKVLLDTTSLPLNDTLEKLAAQFPCLEDAQFREELLREAENTLRLEMEFVVANAQATYRPQADRLVEAFRKLEREAPESTTTEDLGKRFVHLWLMLIDAEIMGETTSNDGKAATGGTQNDERGG